MDVFLTENGLLAFSEMALLSRKSRPVGFLAGRLLSGRFYVEVVFPASDEDWTSPDVFFRLDKRAGGRIIGFFLFSHAAAERRPLAQPHACGKLVLAVKKRRSGGPGFKGFIVDYEGRFFFKPVEVVRDKGGRP